MKNYVQDGCLVTLVAPSGGVVAGSIYLIGALPAVAHEDAADGAEFVGMTKGVFKLAVTAANTPTLGAKAYLNTSNGEITTTASGNTLVGVFTSVKDADNNADVLLTGQVV